jgi:hypothetical protein
MSMHANDWVEVRSKQEILQTLDKNGRLDGMPFMPQMFEYCGKRFKVYKSAHKACDPIYTGTSRSLANAVHLSLRCDGQTYGGCQAGCCLFWKEAWLKPVCADGARISASHNEARLNERPASCGACTEKDVWKATRRNGGLGEPDDDTQFVCQNTQLPEFTKPLRWWNPAQYVKDYVSGNVTLVELMRGGIYVLFGRRCGTKFPVIRRIYNGFQKLTGGVPSPVRFGTIPVGQPQPTATLNLQPGDLVRVKSHDEILATLDTRNRNRGLFFDVEMVPYCGGAYRVVTQVEKFIDEKTGRMKSLKTPAVILEDVACRSRFSGCRMFCPRGLYAWWREVWLERVEETGKTGAADISGASSRLEAHGKLETVQVAD